MNIPPDSGLERNATDRTRAVIAALLGSSGGTGPGFFLNLADRLESVLDGTRTGSDVGGYRLVRLLGHGGSGVVYLGERPDDPDHPEVAVKVLVPGLADESAQRRFLREATALRNLRHPGIVRLLEGGVTDDGAPYIIRESVKGTPIDRYCEVERLTVSDRLRLFLQVCEAVAYAHRMGVVHGDLKPANVLVDEEESVRVIDFSSSALLAFADGSARREGIAFTPSHASPEQRQGGALRRRTDVYGLGVLLHELLTGELPRRSGAAPASAPKHARHGPVVSMDRCLTWLRRDDPARLWEAVRQRRTSFRRMRRALQGGLEDVVQRALQVEMDARHSNVEELAAEIRRELARQGSREETRDASPYYLLRRPSVPLILLGSGVLFLAVRALLPSREGD